jgi:hypothetical protein
VAGALPGGSYLALLEDSGFIAPEILGPTGYTTSRFTAAYYLRAVRAP